MSTILDRILERKREEIALVRSSRPLAAVREAAESAPRPRNFYSAVAGGDRAGPGGDASPPRRRASASPKLIAEIKKASPSAGLIRPDFDPVAIAGIYHDAGAAALSVLTDEFFFQGRLDFIERVRSAVPLPVLRKDFIIDEYQIYEARAAGADAVLLIAECLSLQQISDLMILSNELRMTVLLEVHEADTLLRVRSAVGFPLPRYGLLGINNRDLKTQTVDLGTTSRLIELVADGTVVVAESGVRTRDDVLRLKRAGARALLVGETFMRAPDIGAKVHELFG